MLVTCPSCNKKLNVPESAAGKKVRCPGCQKAVPVPNGQVAAAPAPRPEAPRPAPPPIPPDDAVAEPPDEADTAPARSTMRCAACKADALQKLPPNQFSRNPGYVCTACNAFMRPPGSTGFNVFVVVLGGFGVLIGVIMCVAVWDAPTNRNRLISASVSIAAIGVGVAGWGIKQLRLPMPLDAPVRPSRLGFYLVVFLLAALVVGGALFGFAYFLHEM